LPDSLRDQTFSTTIKNEESVQRWLVLLTKNLNDVVTVPSQGSKVPASGNVSTTTNTISNGSFGFTASVQSANWNV
jgi:hypothetical protein